MSVSFIKKSGLSRGQRGLSMAYAGVAAVAAGITMLITSSLPGLNAIPKEPSFYDNWAIIAGGASAGIALYLLRDWMGKPGFSGVFKAAIGAVLVALLAAFLAGTLIAPFSGSVMAPILLVAAFFAMPSLFVAWMAVAIGAHFLLVVWNNERAYSDDRAISQLSRLTQLNLYGR